MKLIIHADDFGYSQSVNKAIINLAKKGVLTSTSILANSSFENYIEELLSINHISLGVHLNLTEGKPISPLNKITSLVNKQGNFFGKKLFKKKCFLNKISKEHIICEMTAQYDYVTNKFNENFSFVDTHHGVHTKFKVCRDAILELGLKREIKSVRTKNIYYVFPEKNINILAQPNFLNFRQFDLKKHLSRIYNYHINKKLHKYFSTADGMIVSEQNSVVPVLKKILNLTEENYNLEKIFYIVIHPSIDIIGLEKSNLKESRVEEYEFLINSTYFNVLTKKLELTNFKIL